MRNTEGEGKRRARWRYREGKGEGRGERACMLWIMDRGNGIHPLNFDFDSFWREAGVLEMLHEIFMS